EAGIRAERIPVRLDLEVGEHVRALLEGAVESGEGRVGVSQTRVKDRETPGNRARLLELVQRRARPLPLAEVGLMTGAEHGAEDAGPIDPIEGVVRAEGFLPMAHVGV